MESSAGERRWTGYVVPALVTLLLGIQFFLGFRGFDQPDGGLLGLLEAPGALLGWGGVVILAVLLGWLIAGLVGRDLFGLQGASGLVVRLVGCVALGLALSGLAGLLAGRSAGGEVGAGIGDLLGTALGHVPAILILALMAVPALVLSISPFFTTGPKVGRPGSGADMDALAELEPKPGLYEGTTTHQPKPLYPERRFDEDGHEIPMSFGGRDVGPVRYADDEPDPEEALRARKPEPVPAPDAASLPEGVRFADGDATEEAEEARAPSDPVEADDRRIPLADGVRYADEVDEPDDESEDEEELEPEADAEAASADEEVGEPAPPLPRSRPRQHAPTVPAVTPRPVSAAPSPEVRGADALGQLQDEDEGARYRAKLEDSGIFDEPPPPKPDPGATPGTKKKAAARKRIAKRKTPAKKKPAAKKTAAPAKRKKATPRKKAATPAKKKPAAAKKATPAKKKAATAKKATPAKKKAQRPAARKKAAPKKAAPRKEPADAPARRKGAATGGPPDEIYRRAVGVAMERGAASSVLLSRRLGIGYAQARTLIERLVTDGILGEMTPSGSRPLLVTEEEWEERAG